MRAHAHPTQAWERLGDHLRQARITQGVTQEFMATWLGINRFTVARIEAGRTSLLVSHLSGMELALGLRPGVSLEVLVGAPDPIGATRGEQRSPSHPPTRRELATEKTLCGHTPRCPD